MMTSATNGIDNNMNQLDTISIGLPHTNITNVETIPIIIQFNKLEKKVKWQQYWEMFNQCVILLLLIYVNYLIVPDIESNTSKINKLCAVLSDVLSSNITNDDFVCS